MRSNVKSWTPTIDPTMPPPIRNMPIRKSTLPRRQWEMTPESDDATIWLAPVPTATVAGIPIMISSGVSRNPPPTPNRPDSTPMPPPIPRIRKTFTDVSASGR